MESNAKNNPTPNINDIPDALFTRAEFHEELSEEAGFSNPVLRKLTGRADGAAPYARFSKAPL